MTSCVRLSPLPGSSAIPFSCASINQELGSQAFVPPPSDPSPSHDQERLSNAEPSVHVAHSLGLPGKAGVASLALTPRRQASPSGLALHLPVRILTTDAVANKCKPPRHSRRYKQHDEG